ncbi:ATP-dependent Clp protease ATP-binding subunit [Candidatus Uhrbacteria bacterium]|nr:ATP-dependent Clp protease ATP-binding subunit [Candidatus Uhrbacteria bacterium]
METLLKKCSDNLLHIFVQAAKQAVAQGKRTIDPCHLFFGLTHPDVMAGAANGGAARPAKKKVRIAALDFSPLSAHILTQAALLADSLDHTTLGPEHLFVTLLHSTNPSVKKILKKNEVDTLSLQHQLLSIVDHSTKILDLLDTFEPQGAEHAAHDHHHAPAHAPGPQTKAPSALAFFSTNLTDEKNAARLDPVIGRGPESERLIRILARRTKNNPILVGPPGVGKTAIVEGLAKRIAQGDVPPYLANKRIHSVDLALLIAGCAFRGELEIRLKALIDEVRANENVILFIDEIHNLVGAGSSNGSMDVANILKPALARGELRCIGATTFEEYKRYIEDDSALERRFQPIIIKQPSAEETHAILEGILPSYERYHGVTIMPEALSRAVYLTDRYVTEKYFPDKAIDVIDEAAAQAKIDPSLNATITPQIIATVLSAMTGVPLAALNLEEKEKFLTLEHALSRSIVGQDHIKKEVAKSFQRAYGGLREKGRPLASFLFLGPSGVGKTELAKVIAQELFGANGLIKLDMSEFSESFSVARLVGAPSGYVGYKEGGRLTEGVRRNPHSLILFDEIEKAHPRVLNVLLQILDDGTLTDMAGRAVDFSNTAIVLTSNIGSSAWNGSSSLGFAAGNDTRANDTRGRVLEELKKTLSAELLNRLDHTLVFHQLEEKDIRAIICLQLERLREKVCGMNVTLSWKDSAVSALCKNSALSGHGARDIRHHIEEHIEDLLAESLLSRKNDNEALPLTLSYRSGTFTLQR